MWLLPAVNLQRCILLLQFGLLVSCLSPSGSWGKGPKRKQKPVWALEGLMCGVVQASVTRRGEIVCYCPDAEGKDKCGPDWKECRRAVGCLCPGSSLTMLPVGSIMLATGLGNRAQVLTYNLHKLFKGALESIRQKCCKENNTTETGDRQGYNLLFSKPSCSLLYIFRGKKKKAQNAVVL